MFVSCLVAEASRLLGVGAGNRFFSGRSVRSTGDIACRMHKENNGQKSSRLRLGAPRSDYAHVNEDNAETWTASCCSEAAGKVTLRNRGADSLHASEKKRSARIACSSKMPAVACTT